MTRVCVKDCLVSDGGEKKVVKTMMKSWFSWSVLPRTRLRWQTRRVAGPADANSLHTQSSTHGRSTSMEGWQEEFAPMNWDRKVRLYMMFCKAERNIKPHRK